MAGSRPKHQEGVLVEQRHLGMNFLAVWVMITTSIQWIMLDMYLPALPVLKEEFSASEELLNVSLNSGIIATAFGMLISGSIADRYGRKPVLLLGLTVSGGSMLICSFSDGITALTIMRGIGGLGSGFIGTVLTAIIRDSFEGRRFQNIMTILQSVAAVAPVAAPTLGSMIINYSSWRFIFVFLGAATFVTEIPFLFFTETWPSERRTGASMKATLGESGKLLKNRSFTVFLILMCCVSISMWAYIAVSSYVFINDFVLSNVKYGIFYGTGAVISVLAPTIYLFMFRRINRGRITAFTIILNVAASILLFTAAGASPLLFLLSVLPLIISEGMIRPLGMVALLEDRGDVAGSASALMHFTLNFIGIVGTTLATLNWPSMTFGLAVIASVSSAAAAVLLIYMYRKGMMKAQLWPSQKEVQGR